MHLRKMLGITFFLFVATTVYNPFVHIFYQIFHTNPQIRITTKDSHVIPKTEPYWVEVKTDRNINQMTAELSDVVQEKDMEENMLVSTSLPEKYICFRSDEEWPNRMFMLASSYGIAKRFNMTVITKPDILPFFEMDVTNSLIRFLNDTSICKKATIFRELKADRFDDRILKFKSKPQIYMDGFFQSWKYFANAEMELRALFQFDEWLVYRAEEKLESIKNDIYLAQQEPKDLIFVGIHMQRKRFAKNGTETMASKSYFYNAMKFFVVHFNHVIFVACSDTPGLAEENLPEFVHFVHNTDPVFQMCLLTRCNHTIMSPGAFEWWASWLADGITTYFQSPVKEKEIKQEEFNTSMSDYYWPNWIPIFA
ncbi:FUT1_2 [Acanthosepion pharaonis]|uniref:L-Fucosyltransferase n=1 Tax=Acanthosepion pharaonis TaxID=158019 RepID=A0A812DIQ7_ACAPH|nr:FUT1_2 [Sepia pharaonis]